MRIRRPSIGRIVGVKSVDSMPSPPPKNQLQVRIEAQQKTIKALKLEKTKLLGHIRKLMRLIENDLLERLPKKLGESVRSTLEEIRDELE